MKLADLSLPTQHVSYGLTIPPSPCNPFKFRRLLRGAFWPPASVCSPARPRGSHVLARHSRSLLRQRDISGITIFSKPYVSLIERAFDATGAASRMIFNTVSWLNKLRTLYLVRAANQSSTAVLI
eukprot:6199222-Pleurochrysis_carterae.AAC.1